LGTGGTLLKIIEESKKSGKLMQESAIISYFLQMCFGLLYVHEFGMPHGNLKLSNVVCKDIVGKNILRLADFEICSLDISVMKDTLSSKFNDTISYNYYAPELLQLRPGLRKVSTLPTDMWALGVILYFMSTYRFPFDAYSEAGRALLLTTTYDESPLSFSPIIKKLVSMLLVKDPNNRTSVYHLILSNILQECMHKELLELQKLNNMHPNLIASI
jgi:serine/threonine protein kinase